MDTGKYRDSIVIAETLKQPQSDFPFKNATYRAFVWRLLPSLTRIPKFHLTAGIF